MFEFVRDMKVELLTHRGGLAAVATADEDLVTADGGVVTAAGGDVVTAAAVASNDLTRISPVPDNEIEDHTRLSD